MKAFCYIMSVTKKKKNDVVWLQEVNLLILYECVFLILERRMKDEKKNRNEKRRRFVV